MRKIRVFYEKMGRAKYFSHLDFMRAIMRTLKMSGLNVKYTEGFNPRIYLTFALPLSLGYEGSRESMDFDLLDDKISLEEIKAAIKKVVPKSIKIIEAAEAEKDPSSIKFAQYQISYTPDDIEQHLNAWNDLLSLEKIEVLKKAKKRRPPKKIDIKPDILSISIEKNDEDIIIIVKLPAGIEHNVNPRLLVQAFENKTLKNISPSYLRLRILDEAGNDFK